MAFKTIASLDADQTISIGGYNKKERKENPISIEGYFLGSRKIASQKDKKGYSFIHVFQTLKGNVGVWGKTALDDKLAQVIPGTMTQVNFTGMKPTKNGEMYTFKVAVDTDNTIEVNLQDELPRSATHNGFSNVEDSDGDDTYGNDDVDEDAAQQFALQQAERAAKVQALLKSKKNKTA